MPAIIHNFNGTYIEHVDTYIQHQHTTSEERVKEPTNEAQTEDIQPIDTSFFCIDRFTFDIIEKNVRQTIKLASSKANACRSIMSLETQGYILLSNETDERKAELVNPFAAPKYTLTGEDFKKARNR